MLLILFSNTLKQRTADLLLRVLAVLLVLFQQGCLWVSDPDIWPNDFVDKSTLPDLAGKKDIQILEMFGPPAYVIHKNDKILYLYERHENDSAAPVLALPLFLFTGPMIVGGSEVSCVLLEFDSKRELKGYKIKTQGAASSRQLKITSKKPNNCIALFDLSDGDISPGREYFSTDSDQVVLTNSDLLPSPDYVASGCNLTVFEKIDPTESDLISDHAYMAAGSDLATFQQYKLYLSYPPNDPARLCYLCLAANNGHPNAQIEVGRHIAQGIYGIHRDYRRAYVWYSLAARGGIDTHIRLIRHKMTNKQIIEAEKMLKDWEPGQCVSDLSQISTDDNHGD